MMCAKCGNHAEVVSIGGFAYDSVSIEVKCSKCDWEREIVVNLDDIIRIEHNTNEKDIIKCSNCGNTTMLISKEDEGTNVICAKCKYTVWGMINAT